MYVKGLSNDGWTAESQSFSLFTSWHIDLVERRKKVRFKDTG